MVRERFKWKYYSLSEANEVFMFCIYVGELNVNKQRDLNGANIYINYRIRASSVELWKLICKCNVQMFVNDLISAFTLLFSNLIGHNSFCLISQFGKGTEL